MNQTITDVKNLVERLQAHDTQAYAQLYDNYSGALYGVIFKVLDNEAEACDTLQDVFVKIWQKIGLYDASKGSLYTWMLNIARNTSIDRLRQRQRRQTIQTEQESVYKDESSQPNVETIGVRQLVEQLKPDLKEMIDLHYFGGMTHQEISDHKQMPLGTVKTKLRTAMQRLKNIFLSLFF